MVCNGYVAGRIAASLGLATFSNLEMQHSPKIFCIFLQKVLAKNTLLCSDEVKTDEEVREVSKEIDYMYDELFYGKETDETNGQ